MISNKKSNEFFVFSVPLGRKPHYRKDAKTKRYCHPRREPAGGKLRRSGMLIEISRYGNFKLRRSDTIILKNINWIWYALPVKMHTYLGGIVWEIIWGWCVAPTELLDLFVPRFSTDMSLLRS